MNTISKVVVPRQPTFIVQRKRISLPFYKRDMLLMRSPVSGPNFSRLIGLTFELIDRSVLADAHNEDSSRTAVRPAESSAL